jgi:hypothetical protein
MKVATRLKAKIPRHLKNLLKDSKINYYYLYIFELKVKIWPKKYFGQTAEDAILMRYLPETKGFYVDIGAGHPVIGSNTFALYLRGYVGVCVDPIHTNARLFKSFRPRDQFYNVLIGPREEVIDFWQFEPYEYSTADKVVAEKVKLYDGVRLLDYSKIDVKPLSSIIPNVSQLEAQLMSIDVEGFDLKVLESNDWTKFHPRVICVEELNENLNENFSSVIGMFLKDKNYTKVAWTGMSSIFVETSYLASMPKL